MTKQHTNASSGSAPQGDGDPDTSEGEALSVQIKNYFDERWGQYPPILKAEADLIASLMLASVQTAVRRKAS